jgi:hypothetical protein
MIDVLDFSVLIMMGKWIKVDDRVEAGLPEKV